MLAAYQDRAGPSISNKSPVAVHCCPTRASHTGLEINPDRPHHKLPYRGAWLWIGPEMIHLMELPNPDPTDKDKRPGRVGHQKIMLDRGRLCQRVDGNMQLSPPGLNLIGA